MIVRTASESDIPRIIELLRISLGEDRLPKSEAFWRWKHQNNPFGSSPVLVAEEDEQLIGVRAFIRWRWTKGGTIYDSLRAVDTATHPRFQGKGIFRALTLKLVDQCVNEGAHFIFNTPNKSSRPGYLRMGWEDYGKLRVCLRPSARMLLVRMGLGSRKSAEVLSEFQIRSMDRLKVKVDELIMAQGRKNNHLLVTAASSDYFRWRYEQVPVLKYYWMHNLDGDASYCIFFRLKETLFGTEARITDFLVHPERSAKGAAKELRRLAASVDFVSTASQSPAASMLHQIGSSLSLPVGPRITLRNLNLEKSGFLANFDQWHPTLGDLELF